MRKYPLVLFLGCVAALALVVWMPDPPASKIAEATTFASQVEHAKRLHPDTRLTIKDLVAELRAADHLDPRLDRKRQFAVARLEAILATADDLSLEVSSQSR